MTVNINDALAVVFSQDGVHHVLCATTDEMLDAIDAAVAAGDKPVVFTRQSNRTGSVVNTVTGTVRGTVTMAHTIHNGVRL